MGEPWTIHFTAQERRWLQAFKDKRLKPQFSATWTGLPKAEAEQIGINGEGAFACKTGLKWDAACLDGVDPGYDFRLGDAKNPGPTIDVKARRWAGMGLLVDSAHPLRADIIVLVLPLHGSWPRQRGAPSAFIAGWIPKERFYELAHSWEEETGRRCYMAWRRLYRMSSWGFPELRAPAPQGVLL